MPWLARASESPQSEVARLDASCDLDLDSRFGGRALLMCRALRHPQGKSFLTTEVGSDRGQRINTRYSNIVSLVVDRACSAWSPSGETMWSSERGHVGDAWAHGGEEGRGKLRKARGSCTRAVIPRWPNGATHSGASPSITGVPVRRTRGTETSQYPEEEESIEMPPVAASERGGAQTAPLSGGAGL